MNELKVGFLTLLAIVSILGVSLKIAGDKTGFGKYVSYRTILDDATGINENATIKVAGITAGKILKIELAGSQALVIFEITEDIKVTQFSKLKIKSVGFLGDKYIDVHLGNPNAPRLEEGSMILAEGGGGFEEIGKDASDVLKDIKEISQRIKEAMVDENDKNMIKEIVSNVNETVRSLKNVIASNEEKLNRIVSNLDKVTAQLAYETDRYQDGSFMNDLDGLKPILANIDDISADLKTIVGDMKDGKGTVGKLLRDEEVIDQVNETLSGVNRLVGRINQYKTDIAIYTGANDKFGSRTDLSLDLIPGPERFFRFGVVLNDYGPYAEEKSRTTTITNGVESTVEERKIDESQFKFNLQIGKRFNRFAFRGGLIETTGGVGFDYLMPDYGFTAGVEAFDYQEKFGPNVRAFTELKIWNVLHTRVMAEDMFSKSDGSSFTFSVGLKFSDEDLASFIGLLAM